MIRSKRFKLVFYYTERQENEENLTELMTQFEAKKVQNLQPLSLRIKKTFS